MKFKLPLVLSLFLLPACSNPTPENYFDTAVLNTNIVNDFASETFTNQLAAYGKSKQNGVNPATTMVDGKASYIEGALKKIKALKETEETKEMLHTSEALFEYVLPVYKNEYAALAKLSDQGGKTEDIESLGKEVDDKYGRTFDSLYHVLTTQGKAYADKHKIQVNWGR